LVKKTLHQIFRCAAPLNTPPDKILQRLPVRCTSKLSQKVAIICLGKSNRIETRGAAHRNINILSLSASPIIIVLKGLFKTSTENKLFPYKLKKKSQ
jgi:hypothetical protein